VENAEDDDECLCEDPACAQGWSSWRVQRFARWDGRHLEMGPRAENNATEWALVYQQKSVPENATFPEHAVSRSTNGLRLAGRLEENRSGHPLGGMHGLYVIAGCDPAISGAAGLIVEAIDKKTQKRYLLNAWSVKSPTKAELTERMKHITTLYEVDEWRVEKTGLLQFFTQDAELRRWMQTRGVRFTEHLTSGNKWDPAFGISSMAGLFGEYRRSYDAHEDDWQEVVAPLIELPRPNTEGIKTLIHQLVTWTPELNPAKVPQDVLMALWFAEIGAREYLGVGRRNKPLSSFQGNRFVSPRSSKNRIVVNLADHRQGIA
jgi:hypothetical protein